MHKINNGFPAEITCKGQLQVHFSVFDRRSRRTAWGSHQERGKITLSKCHWWKLSDAEFNSEATRKPDNTLRVALSVAIALFIVLLAFLGTFSSIYICEL